LASGAYWRCPICLRRVPDKVAECYCGRKRQAGDGPDAGDATGGPGATRIALAALALVGLAVFFALRRTPTPPTPAPRPGASAASAPGPEPAREPASDSSRGVHTLARDVPAFTSSSPTPATGGAQAAPSPAAEPRPTPTPEDSVDARREQGRLAFDLAMRNLQGRVEVLRRRLEHLATTCPAEATRVIGCDALRQEIARDAEEIRSAAEQAVEQARLGWVDPGAVRDARERYGMREGDVLELLARANEALRR
jgi:hypothetical protein